MRTVVRARIDEKTKQEAAAVIDAIGLTVSDAFRLMMVRIATEKRLPFEPPVPNAETIAAMEAARRGDLATVDDVDGLMADLHADDQRTAVFEQDYRREKKGRCARTADAELAHVVAELAEDRPLPPHHRDRALGGQWRNHRGCHVRPATVLIFRKSDAEHVDLVSCHS